VPRQRAAGLHAALYTRLAPDDPDQVAQQQLDLMHVRVRERGWLVQSSAVDRAAAHDLRGRRSWRALLTRAQAGAIDVVLVWALDRPFGSTLEALRSITRLSRLGVAFCSMTEPIDTTGPAGTWYAVLSAAGSIERAQQRAKTQAGMRRAQAAGRRIGRPRLRRRR
jgi:DNA invertase Pin-like site-specific DNA recombinase